MHSPHTDIPPDMVEITFVPQAWINDYAIECDPEGPLTWLVEKSLVEGMERDSYESDTLRHHDNAPQWVKEWGGPFECRWSEDES